MLRTSARQASRAQGTVHPRWRPKLLEAHVNEFVELADWFGWRAPRDCLVVDSLPIPAFQMKNRQYVSFSTNNYLGLPPSPRMRTAAIRGIEAYGGGNSDSRLLGDNLPASGKPEPHIAV